MRHSCLCLIKICYYLFWYFGKNGFLPFRKELRQAVLALNVCQISLLVGHTSYDILEESLYRLFLTLVHYYFLSVGERRRA